MESLLTKDPAAEPARLTGEELIPDVVRTWPASRPVFDRYGLHACGGPYGPVETIAYFSRAHAVDLEKLLSELGVAIASGIVPPAETGGPDAAGTIYRRFFAAGMIATLTAGATWGAYLLLNLGLSGSFGVLSPHDVNAHGHAQIFGWVGLFVMGFAYQAFPRFKHGALRRTRLAIATFPVYIAGLVLRTVSEALHPSTFFLYTGFAGAGLEIAAIAIFAWIVAETLLAGGAKRLSQESLRRPEAEPVPALPSLAREGGCGARQGGPTAAYSENTHRVARPGRERHLLPTTAGGSPAIFTASRLRSRPKPGWTLGIASRTTASDRYILLATAWFVAQAIYDVFLYGLTATAGSTEELVARIATYQVPLRDMQIHGFATLMILGVSQRFFPGMLGLGRVPEKLADALLVLINLAVAGEIAGFLGRRLGGGEALALFPLLLEGSVILLTISIAVLAWKLGVFHRPAERDRSVKFLRAAYAWLFISLLMLVLLPLYLWSTAQEFSHAYFGAARHAITVGFISLMIVGVSAKVVPTLNGVPAQALPGLWMPFVLLNAGCALRVLFQTLTDFTPAAFPVAGASGLLEVTGLAVWGLHLLRIMAGRYRFAVEVPAAGGAPAAALPEHIVGWLTAVAPATIPVFARLGFAAITSRFLRETVARTITIRQACALKGIDEAKLLAALDETLKVGVEARGTAGATCGAAPRPVEFVGRLTGT